MDFFAQQDLARRNTRLLVMLFLAAVLALILLTNLAVAAFLFFSQGYNLYSGTAAADFLSYFSWQRFGAVGLSITGAVAIVVLVKWIALSTGGKNVAESMGGTRILPQSSDRDERKVLNVVEEIALAANMPVPAVYVLNDERGINAFAAGISPADAVIGITRGAISHLKRHELQGVVAHEFSHILNGDMRLNIRLAALLKGITFVGDVGHFLMRSSRLRTGSGSSNNAGAVFPVLGLALWMLGWLGGICAGFIKASISRQKEYLADASAVQFTRDAHGIADALKVIGGYIPGTFVHTARAVEMSHIFFGQIQHRLWQVFATHPPLDKRISRLDPQWNGEFIQRPTQHYGREPTKPGHGAVGVGRAAVVAAAIATTEFDEDSVESPSPELQEPTDTQHSGDAESAADVQDLDRQTATREALPIAFVQFSHEPLGAQALVLSLFIHEHDAALTARQLEIVGEAQIQGLEEMVTTLYRDVRALDAPFRLPLLEMTLPALRGMSAKQYRVFKDTVMALIQSDRQTDLFEWCFFQLLRHYLDNEFFRVQPSRPRHNKLEKVDYHLRAVLSVVAYAGDGNPEQHFAAGAHSLGFEKMVIMHPEQATVAAFSRAVHELADCYPLLKPRILKALVQTASFDAALNAAEVETITSIAAVMDCPVPDLERFTI